jgi:hypothetical protein
MRVVDTFVQLVNTAVPTVDIFVQLVNTAVPTVDTFVQLVNTSMRDPRINGCSRCSIRILDTDTRILARFIRVSMFKSVSHLFKPNYARLSSKFYFCKRTVLKSLDFSDFWTMKKVLFPLYLISGKW